MSINAIVEIALHVESFRNLDLVHQGLYKIELQMYAPNGDSAIPVAIKTKNEPTSGDRIGKLQTHQIELWFIKDTSYTSRTFYIKYQDEEVKINDLIVFQTEIPIDQLKEHEPYRLEAKLFYADVKGNVQSIPGDLEYICYNTLNYTIRNVTEASSEFIDILFEECFSSFLKVIMHTTITEYQFNYTQSNMLQDSMAKILFTNSKGKTKKYVGLEETNRVYSLFLEPLLEAYSFLSEEFLHVVNSCMTSGRREQLNGAMYAPTLSLPWNPVSLHQTLQQCFELSVSHGQKAPENLIMKFSERALTHDPIKIVTRLINDVNMISSQVNTLWNRFLDIQIISPKLI